MEPRQELLLPILTLAEVAKVLRCSKAHVSHLINGRLSGVPPLPTVPFGRRRVVRRETLMAWMKARECGDVANSTFGTVRTS